MTVMSQGLQHVVRHPSMSLRRLIEGRERFTSAPWTIMRSFAPEIDLVVEAGAADGTDTLRLAEAFPRADIVALEPVEHSYQVCYERCSRLDQVVVLNQALAAADGWVPFHVGIDRDTGSTDSSSVLKASRHTLEFPSTTFEPEEMMSARSIDSIVGEFAPGGRVFLWLDLQGYELEALRGSEAVLRSVTWIYLEVSWKPLYDGGASYSEVKKTLQSMGFKRVWARVGRVSGNALFRRA